MGKLEVVQELREHPDIGRRPRLWQHDAGRCRRHDGAQILDGVVGIDRVDTDPDISLAGNELARQVSSRGPCIGRNRILQVDDDPIGTRIACF